MAKDDLFDRFGNFVKRGTQHIKDRWTLDITDLIRAVSKNDAEEVARALNAGVDPNEVDGANRRALTIAVDNNHISIVDLLLRGGADPNLPDKLGDTPLYKSVYWENEDITRALLIAGADVHQKNRRGVSPTEEAKKQSTDKMVNLLEAYRGEKRAKQIEEDRQKHEQMKAKARKVIAQRKEKETRRIAAEQKKIERAQQRMKERAEGRAVKKYKANEENPIPSILHAIRQKDAETAIILYNKFKPAIVNNRKGHAVLLLEAVRYEESEMTKLLIENGADCFIKVRGSEHSVLSFAVSKNAHKLVQFILSKHPEKAVDFLNNPDQLLSLQFLAYKAPRMLDILLAAGANPFFGGTEGLSPIVNAIEKASIAILPVLAKHKINLDTRIDGRTPLEWAIFHSKKDWVNGLLAEKVDITLKNPDGKTPKELAEELGRKEIAKLL